jgi:hypothetical protein
MISEPMTKPSACQDIPLDSPFLSQPQVASAFWRRSGTLGGQDNETAPTSLRRAFP